MTQAITLTRVLKAITDIADWYDEAGDGAPMTLKKFTVTMIEAELINNKRKIEEWWDLLHTAGYLTTINQHSSKTVPAKMMKKLDIIMHLVGGPTEEA